MVIGERGQITIPKALRERFGLQPKNEVELVIIAGQLVLRKKPQAATSDLSRWVGFLDGEPEDVDTFIEEIRGR